MDAFSLHLYGESPRVPPTLRHPHTTSLGIADYPKLVRLLGRAFDGTAQPGSKLPVLYARVRRRDDRPADEGAAYTGQRGGRAGRRRRHRRATTPRRSGCARRQPTVAGIYIFHVVDETRLEGLQSGVRYADGTPKASLEAVRRASLRP